MSIFRLFRKPSISELKKCAEAELAKLRKTPRTLANGENLERLISEYETLLNACNEYLEACGEDEAEPQDFTQEAADIYERFTSIQQ